MFLCRACQSPDDRASFFESRGPCESCGIVSQCNDVRIHKTEHSPKIIKPAMTEEENLAYKKKMGVLLTVRLTNGVPKRNRYWTRKEWKSAYIRYKNRVSEGEGYYRSGLNFFQIDLKKIFAKN